MSSPIAIPRPRRTIAVGDFLARIAHYERAYQPIDDEKASYIKVIDVGRQVVINRIQGYLASRLVSFIINLHVTPRTIWLTRHGGCPHSGPGLDPGLP